MWIYIVGLNRRNLYHRVWHVSVWIKNFLYLCMFLFVSVTVYKCRMCIIHVNILCVCVCVCSHKIFLKVNIVCVCVFVQVWALSHKSICSRLYIPCCVCFLIFSQGWKPLWVLWSSQWRSCQMWWFWLCSVWVYLPSSVYSCLWVIFGKSVSSGQSTVLKPTCPMGARALTSMNTSWMIVSRQSSDYLW